MPEVESWSVGKILAHRPSPYDYMQFSVFKNLDALNKYRNHPDHKPVKTKLKQVFDYEVIDSED